jgi:ATP-dependent DNA ligase
MAKPGSRVSKGTDIEGGTFPSLDLPLPIPFPPMEAKRSDAIPPGTDWLFEPKWDGFRAIAFRSGEDVVLQSKAGQPLGRYFPEILDALRSLSRKRFVLDGEIVVPVEGRLSFDDLLLRLHPAASRVKKLAAELPAQYFVFDVLAQDAQAFIERTMQQRRELLETFFESVPQGSRIRLSPATTDRKLAEKWFSDFGNLGLDGVMAKKLGARYHSGEREGMVKVKHFKSADCVVGGFRYATGSTTSIGSLLLGLFDDDKNLVFIGHTSSFTKEERKDLGGIVEPLRGENPFSIRVPGGPSRWASERSGEWEAVRPELVCEVEYDYFSQGRFRHGSKFLRWRPDKKPAACTMDQVDPSRLEGSLQKLGMA